MNNETTPGPTGTQYLPLPAHRPEESPGTHLVPRQELTELLAAFEGQGEIRVLRTLALVDRHIRLNFPREEHRMASLGQTALAALKDQHRAIETRFRALLKNAAYHSLDDLAEKLRQLLADWLQMPEIVAAH